MLKGNHEVARVMVEASVQLLFQLRRSSINNLIEFMLRFICGSFNAVNLTLLQKRIKVLPKKTNTQTSLDGDEAAHHALAAIQHAPPEAG